MSNIFSADKLCGSICCLTGFPGAVHIVVDCEMDGPSRDANNLLEIGATAFAFVDGEHKDMRVVGRFGNILAPIPGRTGEASTLDWWRKSAPEKYLRLTDPTHGHPIAAVFNNFLEWIRRFGTSNVYFWSDFPQFDGAWIDHYLMMAGVDERPTYLQFGFQPMRCFDDMFRAVTKDCRMTNTKDVCARVGVEFLENNNAHNAMDDALFIGMNGFRVLQKTGIYVE